MLYGVCLVKWFMMQRDNLRKLTGLILWWTEGTKKRRNKLWKNTWYHPVEITNTDPRIIQMFLSFLRKDIGIDEPKLKLQLQVHKGDNQVELEKFWSRVTRIPPERFQKTIVRPAGRKVGKSRGTCKIRYNSREIYERMEKMLDEKVLNHLL